MKVKSFLLTALAASMVLVACDRNDEQPAPNADSMPKRVTIKLPNLTPSPETRAVGDAMEEGSQVALTNFKVFFLDASNSPVTIPQYEGKAQQVYFSSTDEDGSWESITEDGRNLTYHFLPPQTTKVVIVGNQNDIEYSQLTNKVEDVPNDTEAGHPTYTLYGEDDLTEGGAPDDATHQNVYQANVTLTPRVSRFEIYGFEYEKAQSPAANKYTSVKLDKIALNHYYTKYDFVMKNPSEEGKIFDNPTSSEMWTWVEKAQAPWADELSSPSELTLNPGDKKAPNGTALEDRANGENAEDIITYGLAHVAVATNNPELLLTLHGTTSGGTEEPIYLRGQFTNSSAFESGKIYRVLYSFSDEDFDQPERCVELNVKVANWTVVPVTPEF